jgi:hypothetical protein
LLRAKRQVAMPVQAPKTSRTAKFGYQDAYVHTKTRSPARLTPTIG